jgi:DNA-binding NtrC family response regulator
MAKQRVAVGRADDNDVILTFPGVSRKHCVFLLEGEGPKKLLFEDLDSAQGILKDGVRCRAGELAEGDMLSLGPIGVTVLKDPSGNWMDLRGRSPGFPFLLQMPTGEPESPNPNETIPLRPFESCLEALSEVSGWGRQWCALLKLDDIEITRDSDGERLCLWPASWSEAPASPHPVVLDGHRGRWSAAYSGGDAQVRPLLRALLHALEVSQPRVPYRGAPASRRPNLLTCRPSLGNAWEQVEPFLDADLPLLLTGETGAGKEVLARAVHAAGTDPQSPFEVIHCAAIPESLFESELFGIEPNTATGVSGRKGKLELADGGTIFLDEVGEVPAPIQTKLLRVLQDATVTPVGGRHCKPLRARWIAATNRNLRAEAQEGRFRQDLFFRLCGVEIRVPPLRERLGCIPDLVDHFLRHLEQEKGRGVQGLSLEAYRSLMAYPWPGNIRELETAIRRAYFLAPPGGLLQREHLPAEVLSAGPGTALPEVLLDHRRKVVEEATIRQALSAERGNISRAAERLKVTRQTLAKRIRELGIAVGDFKAPG